MNLRVSKFLVSKFNLCHYSKKVRDQQLAPIRDGRVPLPRSAHLMVVPDPTGALLPGQVFLRLTHPVHAANAREDCYGGAVQVEFSLPTA